MSNELRDLSLKVALGQMNRRDFIGRAAVLGVAAPLASQLLSSTAKANPIRGGHLILGYGGGESTNSLDPGLIASSVPANVCWAWGENLVITDPNDGTAQPWLAESWEASADAKKWAFKIRKGVLFSNGKTLTAEDVVATLKRHSDENSKSGALGILKAVGQNFHADGDNLVIELEVGQCRPALSAVGLPSDDPAERRLRRSAGGDRHRRLQDREQRAGRAPYLLSP